MTGNIKDIQLSPHFRLSEFLNLGKYPNNIPTMQAMVNMTYGCLTLLEPARQQVGPIIINSGYRNEEVNQRVGGVKSSQHLTGQAVKAPHRPGCRHPSTRLSAVPPSRGVPEGEPGHRPAPHRHRLAPHLLGPLCPSPPLRPNRVLQMNHKCHKAKLSAPKGDGL